MKGKILDKKVEVALGTWLIKLDHQIAYIWLSVICQAMTLLSSSSLQVFLHPETPVTSLMHPAILQ